MRENWNPNTTFSISQVIAAEDIPAGFYRLTIKAAMFSSVASTYTLSLQEEGKTAATNSFSYAGKANNESWKDWSVMLIKEKDDTKLTITAAYKTPSENSGGKHYCLLLDDFKLEYLAPTDVSSTNTFDMTSWIVNPSFELNTFNGTQADGSSIGNSGGTINKPTGWTCFFDVEGWRDCSSNQTVPADGNYCMNSWFGTIREQKFYQTINNLPEGVYEISAQVRTDQTSTDGIYTYGIAGGEEYKSASWDASQMAGTWNSFENWQTLTARASVIGGGSLQFGLRSDKFVQFDDFHLTYLGSDLLLTELKSSFNTKQVTANDLLENSDYNNVVGTERTTLTTKKSVTPEETVAGWTDAVNDLQEAIDAFTAAKTNYDANAAEVAKATALGVASETITTYTAGSSTTAATALTNTQNLKVAEYNYVTTNYQYGVNLGEWASTGTNTSAADFDNQHWSGTTHKYKNQNDNNGQGWNANSWSIDFNQDVSLPAGNYVFKVAGRQASGDQVTTSLVVKLEETTLGTVSDFPRSNNARGINKYGETAFEGDNSEFANNGNGFGWEWRYVKFTLADDATVNIAINAVATAKYQWVSFGDYTLQTDNEANISLIAYNVALTNAQNVIDGPDYANVTGSERTTLQAAIDADDNLEKTNKTAVDNATTALNNAATAFTAAKDSYNALVATKACFDDNDYTQDLYPYATDNKFEAIATANALAENTAESAQTKSDAMKAAYRTFVESNGMAEKIAGAIDKTSLIENANAQQGDENAVTPGQAFGFTKGTGMSRKSDEPFTAADGTSGSNYFDYWNGSSWSKEISQTIKNLPAGKYILTVTSRGSEDLTKFNLKADNVEKPMKHINADLNSGTFGRGWNDNYIVFDHVTSGDMTFSIDAEGDGGKWMSFDHFRLFKIADILNENDNYTPEASTLDVTLTRTYKTGYWNTFCVPFDISTQELKAAFGDDVAVATYTEDATNPDRIGFNSMTDPSITANVPVLLKPITAPQANIVFTNRTIQTGEAKVEGTNFDFVGNYNVFDKNLPAGSYFISSNVFYRATETSQSSLKSTRAYIEPKSSGSRLVSIFIDNIETTGINGITNDTAQDGKVYNLSGQQVNKVTKGIFVKNGKKYVVK